MSGYNKLQSDMMKFARLRVMLGKLGIKSALPVQYFWDPSANGGAGAEYVL